jgi:hypothetical protein
MDDQRATLAVRPQVTLDLLVDGRLTALALERYGQESGGLVQYEKVGVFVENVELFPAEGPRTPFGTARTIHPEAHDVPRGQSQRSTTTTNFGAVDEDLAFLARGKRAGPRPEAFGRRKKLVEAHAFLVGTDNPFGF